MLAKKRAFITGVTGQDGSYLSEFLLGAGYEVRGLIRRSPCFNTSHLEHVYSDPRDGEARFFLHYGDVRDGGCLLLLLDRFQPDEVYNLAAQPRVRVSFDQPGFPADVGSIGGRRVLEAVRNTSERRGGVIRCYQAGSSEMFGFAAAPQNEKKPFCTRSPHAASKVAAQLDP